MKNYWLQKRNKGFPQDDEFSIQQGCCGNIKCNCGANLDLYYRYQYIQNETIKAWHIDGINVEYTPTECTPVLPESIMGTVLYNDKTIQVFSMGKDLLFKFKLIGTPDTYIIQAKLKPNNYVGGTGSDLLHTTGEIVTQWNVEPTFPPTGKTELVVNYEYLWG